MSKRNDRRAAEREVRKLAFQKLRQQPSQFAPAVSESSASPEPIALPEISEARRDANQANAQFSTGPRTRAGKARSSINALKHGLTSRTVVLAGEDQDEYVRQLDSYRLTHKPVGEEEYRLVQSLLDCQWRLDRMLRMESAIFYKGGNEFAGKFDEHTPAQREALILAEIYLKYEKSLRGLYLQEARLRRCREKDSAELLRLQTLRKRAEQLAADAAQPSPRPPQPCPSGQPLTTHGFDFSTHVYPTRPESGANA
jgi:hypothetical protein